MKIVREYQYEKNNIRKVIHEPHPIIGSVNEEVEFFVYHEVPHGGYSANSHYEIDVKNGGDEHVQALNSYVIKRDHSRKSEVEQVYDIQEVKVSFGRNFEKFQKNHIFHITSIIKEFKDKCLN